MDYTAGQMTRRQLVQAVPAAALALRNGAAAGRKILYFTRSAGFEHSPVKRTGNALSFSEQCLVDLGKRAGFEVECTKDGRVFDGDLGQYAAFAFYTTGDLTGAAKDGSQPMSARGKQRFLDAVRAGKGFIGFHSATDTFHSKGPRNQNQAEPDPYIAMIGGEFVAHGPQQEASLVLASRFPGAASMAMGEGISFTDEWYTFKNFAKDLHVILAQETALMRGDCYKRPDFPSTWARLEGKGRVFHTALGHREDVWVNPYFEAIALGGILWALGETNFDIKPNMAEVTPGANQLADLKLKEGE